MGIRSWLLAFRPKTLTAAFVPILVGTVLASRAGPVDLSMSVFALLAALCIQIGTNLVNDSIDFKKGTDTNIRLGPVRVSQAGLLSSNKVLQVGLLFFLLAFLMGLPLVLRGGAPVLILGIVSILCGYIYTGGKYPLAYHGWGDLFVILFFGFAAVCGVYFIQTGELSFSSIMGGLQVGCLAAVLIAINNLRDVAEDSLNQKKTLAVRFGPSFAKYEIAALYGVVFISEIYWLKKPTRLAGVLPLFCLPLAVRLMKGLGENEPGKIYNVYLARAALIHLLFGILWTVGILCS